MPFRRISGLIFDTPSIDCNGLLRARAKITSHFYAPMHPAWRRCQTGASTPKNVKLFLREPISERLKRHVIWTSFFCFNFGHRQQIVL
jgi:hypothetical protein